MHLSSLQPSRPSPTPKKEVYYSLSRSNTHNTTETPPHTVATAKGHMNQQRQGIQSTKTEVILPLLDKDDTNIEPTAHNEHTYQCFATAMEMTGKTFSDQTGHFLIPSSAGNNYVFVMYNFDSNSIHAEPMPNRTGKQHVQAYKTVHNRLVKAGLRPQLHMLDKECSTLLREFITDQGTTLQMTPVAVQAAMLRKELSKHLRTIASPAYAPRISTCGIDYSLSVPSHSIYSEAPKSIQPCRRMLRYLGSSTSWPRPLHHWVSM
jgi:hypothetical protein